MAEIERIMYKKRPRKKRKDRAPNRRALERELWRIFSLYIRKRDGRCMMGDMFGGCSGPLQAGHIISRRKLPTKYDELNVHGQCASHNWQHNRNPERYTVWFIRNHGESVYWLMVQRSMVFTKVLTIPQLQEKIKEYTLKLGAVR